MKSFIKNILFAIATVFILFSCEKTIEFDSEYIKPKIVVNSIIRPGTRLYVQVEKSKSILNDDNYFEALKDAKVLVYEDGSFLKELEFMSRIDTFRKYLEYGAIEKIPFEKGNYFDTTIVFKEGSTYRLEVSKEGLDPVSCETTIPIPIKIEQVEIDIQKAFHEYYNNYFRTNMQLTIDEPADEENYYLLRIYRRVGIELALIKNGMGFSGSYGGYYSGYGDASGQYPYNDINNIPSTDTLVEFSEHKNYIFSNDPVLSSIDMGILDGESPANDLFSDELMNGKKYRLSLWTGSNRDVYTDFGEYLIVNIAIENISKALYLYYVSREQHNLAIDNPFAEPVPVYTNIKGGLGIFGSESTSFNYGVVGELPIDGKTYIDQNTYNEIYNNYSGY